VRRSTGDLSHSVSASPRQISDERHLHGGGWLRGVPTRRDLLGVYSVDDWSSSLTQARSTKIELFCGGIPQSTRSALTAPDALALGIEVPSPRVQVDLSVGGCGHGLISSMRPIFPPGWDGNV